MTIINPNNENETESDILPWVIFKPDVMSFFHKNKIRYYFNDFQNQNISVLLAKENPDNRKTKQNQTFFHGTYSNLTLFSTGRKTLQYSNDFCKLYLSISLQK